MLFIWYGKKIHSLSFKKQISLIMIFWRLNKNSCLSLWAKFLTINRRDQKDKSQDLWIQYSITSKKLQISISIKSIECKQIDLQKKIKDNIFKINWIINVSVSTHLPKIGSTILRILQVWLRINIQDWLSFSPINYIINIRTVTT